MFLTDRNQMSKFKPYKDIMEQKSSSDSKLLSDGKKELSLTTVNENTGLIQQLLVLYSHLL